MYFIASRYLSTKRKDKSQATVLLSTLGIASGVMTLLIVLGIMNGFQSGFIDSVIQIGSFHAQVIVNENELNYIQNDLKKSPLVKSIIPYKESQVLVRGRLGGMQPLITRGMLPSAEKDDEALFARLNIVRGKFPELKDEILLGEELAAWLAIDLGDTISVLSLAGSEDEGLSTESITLTVSGFFKTGYYEYDAGLGITLASNEVLFSPRTPYTLGIKFFNMNDDQRFKESLLALREKNALQINVWRDYNSGFFNALKVEKTMMMVIIGLIFVVVGVNIFHALKRTIRERYEDIGILRSLGAGKENVRLIFIAEGIIIGFIGSSLGIIAGFLIGFNINGFFHAIEAFINLIMGLLNFIFTANSQSYDTFSVFSPNYFYITEIPVQIPLFESIFIFLSGFFSSSIAAFFASERCTKVTPQEVLRNE